MNISSISDSTSAINFRPITKVIGIGGAGGNAIANMISYGLEGVDFIVANTDAQSLNLSQCSKKIQLGKDLTAGLGAGAVPDVGKEAAMESAEELKAYIEGSHMIFITAGMGGGTGTGAAPVVAKMAKELGVLTVAVVTKPFNFEGMERMKAADAGIAELEKYVDTLIVVSNQNLFRVATPTTSFTEAFKMADDVLYSGVKCVTDLFVMPGLINLDFADVRTIMASGGRAMMGSGEAYGDNRASEAAEAAITNPLLDDVSISDAEGLLINITGGPDMTLFEVESVAQSILQKISQADTKLIFGSVFNAKMEGQIRVSVVATGVGDKSQKTKQQSNSTSKINPKAPVNLVAKNSDQSQQSDRNKFAQQQEMSAVKDQQDRGYVSSQDRIRSAKENIHYGSNNIAINESISSEEEYGHKMEDYRHSGGHNYESNNHSNQNLSRDEFEDNLLRSGGSVFAINSVRPNSSAIEERMMSRHAVGDAELAMENEWDRSTNHAARRSFAEDVSLTKPARESVDFTQHSEGFRAARNGSNNYASNRTSDDDLNSSLRSAISSANLKDHDDVDDANYSHYRDYEDESEKSGWWSKIFSSAKTKYQNHESSSARILELQKKKLNNEISQEKKSADFANSAHQTFHQQSLFTDIKNHNKITPIKAQNIKNHNKITPIKAQNNYDDLDGVEFSISVSSSSQHYNKIHNNV